MTIELRFPFEVLTARRLPSGARMFYGRLAALFVDVPTTVLHLEIRYFAEELGVSDSTIRRWIARLVKAGFLRRCTIKAAEDGHAAAVQAR